MPPQGPRTPGRGPAQPSLKQRAVEQIRDQHQRWTNEVIRVQGKLPDGVDTLEEFDSALYSEYDSKINSVERLKTEIEHASERTEQEDFEDLFDRYNKAVIAANEVLQRFNEAIENSVSAQQWLRRQRAEIERVREFQNTLPAELFDDDHLKKENRQLAADLLGLEDLLNVIAQRPLEGESFRVTFERAKERVKNIQDTIFERKQLLADAQEELVLSRNSVATKIKAERQVLEQYEEETQLHEAALPAAGKQMMQSGLLEAYQDPVPTLEPVNPNSPEARQAAARHEWHASREEWKQVKGEYEAKHKEYELLNAEKLSTAKKSPEFEALEKKYLEVRQRYVRGLHAAVKVRQEVRSESAELADLRHAQSKESAIIPGAGNGAKSSTNEKSFVFERVLQSGMAKRFVLDVHADRSKRKQEAVAEAIRQGKDPRLAQAWRSFATTMAKLVPKSTGGKVALKFAIGAGVVGGAILFAPGAAAAAGGAAAVRYSAGVLGGMGAGVGTRKLYNRLFTSDREAALATASNQDIIAAGITADSLAAFEKNLEKAQEDVRKSKRNQLIVGVAAGSVVGGSAAWASGGWTNGIAGEGAAEIPPPPDPVPPPTATAEVVRPLAGLPLTGGELQVESGVPEGDITVTRPSLRLPLTGSEPATSSPTPAPEAPPSPTPSRPGIPERVEYQVERNDVLWRVLPREYDRLGLGRSMADLTQAQRDRVLAEVFNEVRRDPDALESLGVGRGGSVDRIQYEGSQSQLNLADLLQRLDAKVQALQPTSGPRFPTVSVPEEVPSTVLNEPAAVPGNSDAVREGEGYDPDASREGEGYDPERLPAIFRSVASEIGTETLVVPAAVVAVAAQRRSPTGQLGVGADGQAQQVPIRRAIPSPKIEVAAAAAVSGMPLLQPRELSFAVDASDTTTVEVEIALQEVFGGEEKFSDIKKRYANIVGKSIKRGFFDFGGVSGSEVLATLEDRSLEEALSFWSTEGQSRRYSFLSGKRFDEKDLQVWEDEFGDMLSWFTATEQAELRKGSVGNFITRAALRNPQQFLTAAGITNPNQYYAQR